MAAEGRWDRAASHRARPTTAPEAGLREARAARVRHTEEMLQAAHAHPFERAAVHSDDGSIPAVCAEVGAGSKGVTSTRMAAYQTRIA